MTSSTASRNVPINDPAHTEAFDAAPRTMPLLGLGAAWVGKEEEELVLDVLRRQELSRYYGITGEPPPMAATLEREFGALMGAPYALAVSSGSAALEVALGALGIGPGDEVIVTAWSWIACFTSIVRVGALPVLAEIDESISLAPGEITRLSNRRTKAVIIVHYQGVAADMEPLLAEARQAGIKVIEDCAQSPGALYHGRRAGSMGDIGTFSFQYLKTITSGEGGMVLTTDPKLYERAVRMHDLGRYAPFHSQIVEGHGLHFSGGQFRMNELTAAVALAQFRKLDSIRAHCRALNARVMAHIAGLPGFRMRPIPDRAGDSGFEIYFFLQSPELVAAYTTRLRELGVWCSKGTGTYCHFSKEYCAQGLAHAPAASPFARFSQLPAEGYRPEDFPRTNDLVARFVAIPLGLRFTEDDADYVGQSLRRVHDEILAC